MVQAYIVGYGAQYTKRGTGENYPTGTFQDFYNLMKQPQAMAKEAGPWFVFTQYNGDDARSARTQRQHGVATAIWADIDKGDVSVAEVATRVANTFPNTAFWVYSTKSSTTGDQRSRLLLWPSTPIPGNAYSAYSRAVFEVLESQCGLVLDSTAAEFGRICYGPNPGDIYETAVQDGEALNLHWFRERAQQLFQDDLKSQEAAKGQRTKPHGARSRVGKICQHYDMRELLDQAGFITNNGIDFHYTGQSTRSFATRLHDDDTCYSRSDSVKSLLGGWGLQSDGGVLFNAYDLIGCLRDDGKGTGAASQWLEAHGQELLDTDPNFRYHVECGKYIWAQYQQYQAQETQARIEASAVALQTMQVEEIEGDGFALDWPPGVIGEVAKAFYAMSQRPCKQFCITMAFALYSIASAKHNVNGKGVSEYFMMVGSTGAGKGSAIDAMNKLLNHLCVNYEGLNRVRDDMYRNNFDLSEGGIQRALGQSPHQCVIVPEGGAKLIPMSNGDRHASGLLDAIIRRYDENSVTDVMSRVVSANAKGENDKQAVRAPSLSLVLDTQPQVYEAMLTPIMIGRGLVGRFIPVSYKGQTIRMSREVIAPSQLDKGLLDAVARFLASVLTANPENPQVNNIKLDGDWFFNLSDGIDTRKDEMEANNNSLGAGMFTRYAQHIMRLSALLAIADNPISPQVSETHKDYAKRFVEACFNPVIDQLSAGDVGDLKNTRMAKLQAAVIRFGTINPDTKYKTYKTPKPLLVGGMFDGLINEKYLFVALSKIAAFTEGHLTSDENVRRCVQEAVRQGVLVEEEAVRAQIPRCVQKIYSIGETF